VATVVESNTFPQSAKGRFNAKFIVMRSPLFADLANPSFRGIVTPHNRFVVNRVDFTWCLALMTWKKRGDPCWTRERYPSSSIYVELNIN